MNWQVERVCGQYRIVDMGQGKPYEVRYGIVPIGEASQLNKAKGIADTHRRRLIAELKKYDTDNDELDKEVDELIRKLRGL